MLLKVFVVVLVMVVVISSAAPHHGLFSSDESPEDPPYAVDAKRFRGAKQVFHHKVSNQEVDPDVFRSHHQYVQKDGTIVGEYAILAPDEETLQIVKYTSGKAGYSAKVVHTDDLSVF